MNCGRDEDPVEMFTRSALAMNSKPSVLYILSGTPAWTPADCVNITARYAGSSSISSIIIPRETTLSALESKLLIDYKTGKYMNIVNDSAVNMHSMTFLYKTSLSMDGIPSYYADVTPMAQVIVMLGLIYLYLYFCIHIHIYRL